MLPIEECDSGLWLGAPTARMSIRSKKWREGTKASTPAEFVKMWPTPSATPRGAHTGAISGSVAEDGKSRVSANGTKWGATLETAVKMWPTPCASEARQGFQDRSRGKKGSQESLTTVVVKEEGGRKEVKGSLSPDWTEHYLMGYPFGWTNLTYQELESESRTVPND